MNTIKRDAGWRTEAGVAGFVVRWLLHRVPQVKSGENPFEHDYLSGEQSYVPHVGDTNGRRWIAHDVPFGYRVDLHRALGLVKPPGVAYAACYVISDCEKQVVVGVGSDDGHKLWVNHRLVGARRVERGLGVDQEIYPVRLESGANLILLKIEHISGALEFCLRLTECDGRELENATISISHLTEPVPEEFCTKSVLTENDLFSHLLETQVPKLPCRCESADAFRQWQGEFSNALDQCLGANLPAAPIDARVIDRCDEHDHVREKLHYQIAPDMVASAYLLTPRPGRSKRPRIPVIVHVPGHGQGKDHIAGVTQRSKRDRGEAVVDWEVALESALQAVHEGYAIFIPELLGFGDRLGCQLPARDTCDHAALWALALGYTLPRLNCITISRGIDYLETREDIDASRLAIMGHSLGGFMSMLTAAIEPRIKVAVTSGMLGSFTSHKGGPWFCGSQTIPGIISYGDMAEIAALIAPRPLLTINGLYDSCAPFIYALHAHRTLELAYRTSNRPEAFERFTFPGDHLFQPRPAIDFVKRWMPTH